MSLLAEAVENENQVQRAINWVFHADTSTREVVEPRILALKARIPKVLARCEVPISKPDRAANFVSFFIFKNTRPLTDQPLANFKISSRHEDDSYVEEVREGVKLRLSKLGVEAWAVDLDASLEAGYVHPGYGNYDLWIKGPSRLILYNKTLLPNNVRLLQTSQSIQTELGVAVPAELKLTA